LPLPPSFCWLFFIFMLGSIMAHEINRLAKDPPRNEATISAKIEGRDPRMLEAIEYYLKAPQDLSDRTVILLDPC
jgi:uracil phosphoribosyltransferase